MIINKIVAYILKIFYKLKMKYKYKMKMKMQNKIQKFNKMITEINGHIDSVLDEKKIG